MKDGKAEISIVSSPDKSSAHSRSPGQSDGAPQPEARMHKGDKSTVDDAEMPP